MSANHSETRVYQIPIQYITNELQNPRFTQLQKLQFNNMMPAVNGGTFNFQRSMTMWSWGEKISITALSVDSSATQITIRSECSMPTQVFDWGQNKKNVQAIFSHLEQYAMTTAPQPRQCPNCHNSIAQGMAFCPYCGCSL